jgi:hypothetical protein
MQATSRLLLGLPVRLLVGGPQMPKTARPAAASLLPSRGSYRGRRDVRVHRPIAPGRSSLPVPRESFHPSVPTLRNLASHPLRRLRSCPSQRGHNAGSIARHTVSKWRSRRARNFFVLCCIRANLEPAPSRPAETTVLQAGRGGKRHSDEFRCWTRRSDRCVVVTFRPRRAARTRPKATRPHDVPAWWGRWQLR